MKYQAVKEQHTSKVQPFPGEVIERAADGVLWEIQSGWLRKPGSSWLFLPPVHNCSVDHLIIQRWNKALLWSTGRQGLRLSNVSYPRSITGAIFVFFSTPAVKVRTESRLAPLVVFKYLYFITFKYMSVFQESYSGPWIKFFWKGIGR